MNNSAILFLAIVVFGMSIINTNLNLAQASTPVNGIITQDTTWTKTNGPYSLTGPMSVNQGVRLTIEAGTIVNLNNYFIQVNGTLVAIGTSNQQIHIDGPSGVTGRIILTPSSTGWNEQTSSGCIVENTVLNQVSLMVQNSAKINNNTIIGSISVKGYSTVTNNVIMGSATVSESVVLSSNIITGPSSTGNMLFGGTIIVSVYSGSSPDKLPTITNNKITSGFTSNNRGTLDVALECSGYASITNNRITGCETGIRVDPTENSSGFPIIKRNILSNNQAGIEIRSPNQPSLGSATPIIQENLITNNANGIVIENGNPAVPEIVKNNIYSNDYNLNLGVPYNINVANNWWGTTDQQAISQTIYDNKNNFNSGTVNFVPFLTAPNPQAPSLNTSTPYLSTSPTPSIPEYPFISLAIIIILSTIAVSIYRRK